MNFEIMDNHNSLCTFYRENGLEVSDDITVSDGAVLSLFATADNKTVAAATLSKRYGVYILDYISVAKQNRRGGIGTELLSEMLKKAKAMGADKVYITSKNPKFFKSQGFYEGSPDGVDMNADCVGCPEALNGCVRLPMVIDLI